MARIARSVAHGIQRRLVRDVAESLWIGILVCSMFAASASFASSSERARPYALTEEREACERYEPAKLPFFGDTHVHTAYSFDASSQDTRNTPHDAYRFARGAEVGIQPYDAEGKPLRSARPTRRASSRRDLLRRCGANSNAPASTGHRVVTHSRSRTTRISRVPA